MQKQDYSVRVHAEACAEHQLLHVLLPAGAVTAPPAAGPACHCASVGGLPSATMLQPCRQEPGWLHCPDCGLWLAAAVHAPICIVQGVMICVYMCCTFSRVSYGHGLGLQSNSHSHSNLRLLSHLQLCLQV